MNFSMARFQVSCSSCSSPITFSWFMSLSTYSIKMSSPVMSTFSCCYCCPPAFWASWDFSDDWFLRDCASFWFISEPLLDWLLWILWEPEVAELTTPVRGLPWLERLSFPWILLFCCGVFWSTAVCIPLATPWNPIDFSLSLFEADWICLVAPFEKFYYEFWLRSWFIFLYCSYVVGGNFISYPSCFSGPWFPCEKIASLP